MISSQEIILDVSKGSLKNFYAKQGDNKSREIRVKLISNGVQIKPAENEKVLFRYIKPDGKSGISNAVIENDGTIIIKLTKQVLAVSGTVYCDISIVRDDVIISSATFSISVDRVPLSSDQAISSNEFLLLQETLTKAEASIEEIQNILPKITQQTENAIFATEDAKKAAEKANQAALKAENAADITTDKTLSQLNKAADAKKVGDMLKNISFNNFDPTLRGVYDNLREVDLSSYIFNDFRKNALVSYNPELKKGVYDSDEEYVLLGNNLLYLEQGDHIITNADTIIDNPNLGRTGFKGVILSDIFRHNFSPATAYVYGQNKFSGEYRDIEITKTGLYIFSYKKTVKYETRLYIYHHSKNLFDKNCLFETVNPQIFDGHCTGTYMSFGDTELDPFRFTKFYPTEQNGQFGTYMSKMTSILTFENKEGYSLVVDGMDMKISNTEPYAVYYSNSSGDSIVNELFTDFIKDKQFLVVPLKKEKIFVRVFFPYTSSVPYVKFRIVPNEYLYANKMINSLNLYGKSFTAFGDSYVRGHNLGIGYVWYSLLALSNFGSYKSFGHNGFGLCKSPNTADCLLKRTYELDSESDYYFIVCGRNDSSTDVHIGMYSDMYNPDTDNLTIGTNASFMGGLNYLYKYVVQKHPSSKIIAVTPWSFNPMSYSQSGLIANDYIEAIKHISQKWGIPCLNAAGQCGIHVQSENFRERYFLTVNDQSHLNKEGHRLMLKNSIKQIDLI